MGPRARQAQPAPFVASAWTQVWERGLVRDVPFEGVLECEPDGEIKTSRDQCDTASPAPFSDRCVPRQRRAFAARGRRGAVPCARAAGGWAPGRPPPSSLLPPPSSLRPCPPHAPAWGQGEAAVKPGGTRRETRAGASASVLGTHGCSGLRARRPPGPGSVVFPAARPSRKVLAVTESQAGGSYLGLCSRGKSGNRE